MPVYHVPRALFLVSSALMLLGTGAAIVGAVLIAVSILADGCYP